jgi:hypothetical protein
MIEITEEELRASIFAGDAQSTFALLEPHPTAELKQFQKMLAKIRTEQQQMERTDWNASRVLGGTLVIAGVLCSDTPAQAAGWLTRRRLFDFYIDEMPDPQGMLIHRHDTAWLGDLALRLGEKLRQDGDASYWQFVNSLANHSGAALSLSPAYVRGWLQAVGNERWEAGRRNEQFTLTDWLRKQPRLRECIEAVFATDNTGGEFTEHSWYGRTEAVRWPQAFAALTAEGVLDRAEILESCTARLLRGDKPGSIRGVLDVFEELAPTCAEVRERLGTYQAMAAQSAGIVAKMALRELRALDAEKAFEPMDLASLSEDILARPENGIATGQLTWLETAIKRDPGALGVLLPCFGSAFTHPATSVQQRALKMLRKHLKAADAETVSGLRDAALNVDPALKAEADALFAVFIEPAPADATAPAHSLPAYQPTAVPPMPATAEELVTALAPSYSRGEIAPLEAEQIMAAVAILSHRDRAGLAEVFRPLYERHGDADRRLYPGQLCWFPSALRCLLDAVLGKDHRRERIHVGDTSNTLPKGSSIILRIQELTEELLRGDTVPVLLATPTEASGAIDPTVLEGRLVVYRTLGIKPLPLDLAHAKLRVAGGVVHAEARKDPLGKLASVYAGSQKSRPQIPPTFKAVLPLPGLVENGSAGLPQPNLWSLKGQFEFLPVMLPYDPELVSAASMVDLFHEANGMSSGTGAPGVFPSLAETAGVPGQLTHLALVYALTADRLEHRIAAQDAVLTFASRGLLKPDDLGQLATACWQRDTVRGKRLIEALVQLEESGASAEIFWTVAAMLGPLSKTPEIRGLSEVLLLATRAAVSAGISGVHEEEVPGLAELAAVPKSKRVGAEARRLREAIAPVNAASASSASVAGA